MIKQLQLRITLQEKKQPDILIRKASQNLNVRASEISAVKVLRKSIDARKKQIIYNYKVEVYIDEAAPETSAYQFDYKDVSNSKPIHIIGFGPAGMWAALRCIELGFKPIVLERGKNVQDRRRDLKAINQDHMVNEDSNYCFGEGGAGTYSDGKLYTRSLKRGDVRKIFENLVYHGATDQILVDAHPHIGTNKLPRVVQNIRETILKFGGEIHFENRLIDFSLKSKKIDTLYVQKGEVVRELKIEKVILATGHSARDIFYLLNDKQVQLKAKSFAMGVRVEHPQQIIDGIQYNCKGEQRDELLPAAAYSLVEQVSRRGVYSFCMCPGGFIVPAATADGEVVVNGMSPSKRNNAFANSGIVVEINADLDLYKYEKFGALKGLEFQKELERLAFTVWRKNPDRTRTTTDRFCGRQTLNRLKYNFLPTRIEFRTDAFSFAKNDWRFSAERV